MFPFVDDAADGEHPTAQPQRYFVLSADIVVALRVH